MGLDVMVAVGHEVGVSRDAAVGMRDGPDGDEVRDRDGADDGVKEGPDVGDGEGTIVGTTVEVITVGVML